MKKEITTKVIPVHFGEKVIELHVPKKNLCFNLKRNDFDAPEDPRAEIRMALQNPKGTERLKEMVSKDSAVVILADDRTRVTPQKLILPLILDELHEAGIDNEQIKLVIA